MDETQKYRYVSEMLTVGATYTREQLARLLKTRDATINTGIFQPAGFKSILLFITEEKSKNQPGYKDRLVGDVLCMQGQIEGRKDRILAEHANNAVELLVFYRARPREHPGSAFEYKGKFNFEKKDDAKPANFQLRRVTTPA